MLKKQMRTIPFWITLILFTILTACKSAEPTLSADAVLTEVALTVDAAMATMVEPTATETSPPTPSPTSTASPSPSPTIQATLDASPTQNVITSETSCDNATFVSDVTIPDGTKLAPGATFTKTWKILNSGTCTWTADYGVVFSNGSRMNAETPQSLEVDSVQPGGSVEISIEMVAPDSAGQHVGYWRMQNAAKTAFGDAFYVDILVEGGTLTPTPTATSTGIAQTATSTSAPTQGNTATATATATSTATSTATATPTATATSE